MRKYPVLTATISALLLALISTPANASVPADGTYLCTTGAFSSATPNFTITDGAGIPAKNAKSKKARRATLYAMTPVVQ